MYIACRLAQGIECSIKHCLNCYLINVAGKPIHNADLCKINFAWGRIHCEGEVRHLTSFVSL